MSQLFDYRTAEPADYPTTERTGYLTKKENDDNRLCFSELARGTRAGNYRAWLFEPTPIQTAIIPIMLKGADVIGQAQTGTGKTPRSPFPFFRTLRHSAMCRRSSWRPHASWLAGCRFDERLWKASRCARPRRLWRAAVWTADLAPQPRRGCGGRHAGRLLDLMERNSLNIKHIRTLVLDEADEMLNMVSWRMWKRSWRKTPPERQTALFSATLPRASAPWRTASCATLSLSPLNGIRSPRSTEQRYYLVHESDKTNALTRLFEIEPIKSALIFARTRAETSSLANELVVRGIPAEAIHGDLDQRAREAVLSRFRSNQLKVLVATDVAARGLDIEDISHVFNYHLPDDAEVYVHRIGRTGRAGKTGVAITLISPREKRRLREVEALTNSRSGRWNCPPQPRSIVIAKPRWWRR